MTEVVSPLNELAEVIEYYDNADESRGGYEGGVLDGRCHFGYTEMDSPEPYNLKTAQLKMERLLGTTLNLPPGSKVLDGGCGYGAVSRLLHEEFGFKVVGVDISQRRLNAAQCLNAEGQMPGLQLTGADYHNLPLRSNHFEGAFTMETLVHAMSPERVLGEIWRVLEPGGKLVLIEYSIPELGNLIPPIRNMANRVIKRSAMHSSSRFTHGVFPELLQKAGFVNIKSRDISKNVWPTWHYLWKDAISKVFQMMREGTLGVNTIPGTAMIYWARHHLGYVLSEAQKPMDNGSH